MKEWKTCPICGKQGSRVCHVTDLRTHYFLWDCLHVTLITALGSDNLIKGERYDDKRELPATGWLMSSLDPRSGQIIVLGGKLPPNIELVAPLAPNPVHNASVFSIVIGQRDRWIKAELLRLIARGGPYVAYQIIGWIAPLLEMASYPHLPEHTKSARVSLLGAFLATWPSLRGLLTRTDRELICDQTMFIA